MLLTVRVPVPLLEIVSVRVATAPKPTWPNARLPVRRMIRAHAAVVNVASDPFVVPPTLVATARKWYSVWHASPVSPPLPIATGTPPAPRDIAGVVLP